MFAAILTVISTWVSATVASAQNPAYGAHVSVQIMQQLLVAPPLPSLEGGHKSVAPIGGYVTAAPVESVAGPDGAEDARTTGEFQGFFGGLGLTTASKGDITYFVFGIASSVTGEMLSNDSGGFHAKDVKSTGLAAVSGIAYRIFGDKTSATGLGLFGGPGLISINSSLNIEPASGGEPTAFTTSPNFLGAYTGVQFKVRIGKVLINPYVVNLITLDGTCRDVNVGKSGSVSSTSLKCRNGNAGFDVPSGFLGAGLFAGYGRFRFNILAQNLTADPNMNIKSYAATWAFEF